MLQYTTENNIQMLIQLLKAHGIRYVVASPGTTNISFVASIQSDDFFKIISSADERSAAYIACGLAAECGEPVVLSCTGATASRNYYPGLTEAFYRKLPVLAITSSQPSGRIGNLMPQVTDRRQLADDISLLSVHISPIYNAEDEWKCNHDINKALLELRHKGGGPVHIDVETIFSNDFSASKLPNQRVIRRICHGEELPELKGKIGVFVGAHNRWDDSLTESVDLFCEKYGAVVFCDPTSNYKGKYKIYPKIVLSQTNYSSSLKQMDILIHIGEVSGIYVSFDANEVWRINPDGEPRDTFKRLKYVFEMDEKSFFDNYAHSSGENIQGILYYKEWQSEYERLSSKVPELPFSNIWIAQRMHSRIPLQSRVHLGILNSLRAWGFFPLPDSVEGYCNTGGFGIDGNLSSLIGASLFDEKRLYFGIIGDLAFFYDMNSLGNRHVGNNLRIMLINNGRGTEFRMFNHRGSKFGDETDKYIAAAGHYGSMSRELVKHYAEDLGLEYIFADDKESFQAAEAAFLAPEIGDKSILFEVFTDYKEESEALEMIMGIEKNVKGMAVQGAINVVKTVVGEKGVDKAKNMKRRLEYKGYQK